MKHRVPPLPESMRRHSQKGMCRWCAQPITKPNGDSDTRRTWHPDCVKIYRVAAFSSDQRAAVFERDRGVCAQCDAHTVEDMTCRTESFRKVGKPPPYWAYPPMGNRWQADHIRPLLEANGDMSYFLLSNLQTLCHACHVAKGIADRRRRKEALRSVEQRTLQFA